MPPLTSIRFNVIFIIVLLMVIPVLIIGSVGILYYRDVVRQHIWNDNLAQAKAISALTTNYVDLGVNYLNSIAARPLVISAIEKGDSSFLNASTHYAAVESLVFDSAFITDASGTVLSYTSMKSGYPYSGEVGKNFDNKQYVRQVLNTSSPYVSDGMKNEVDGHTTVYVGVPIKDFNDSTIGAFVATMDLGNYTNLIVGTQVSHSQYIYAVNKTGHVMVHTNKSYMGNMTDFSTLPAVQDVINGRSGIVEQEFPFENDVRLVAYAPVAKYGWGVVVATPVEVAYQPITQFTWYFIAFLIALIIIGGILSVKFGDYITRPILNMSDATAKIPQVSPKMIEPELPLRRKDEIGNLARAILSMANMIKMDRDAIISAGNKLEKEKERAEEEKQRAELYVDIMGHDINNLNQATLANLEIIKATSNLTDNQKEMIGSAISSVMSSAGIINNVRKLQKITGEELHVEKVDIDSLIQECIKEAYHPDGKTVVIRYTSEKGRCVIGTPLLKEVFCNLIDNSIKYSKDEVEIDIQVKETQIGGKKVYEVSVSDSGYGIPDEIKQKLFQRFQRGTAKAHGKGLGLYIVKRLLEKFGGSIQIKDRIPGDYSQGTTFIITLPVAEDS